MSEPPHTLIVCAGSNTLSRNQFEEAISEVSSWLITSNISDIITSPDVTGKSSALYLNAVISGHTRLSFPNIDTAFADIEVKFGRTPDSKSTGYMPLDIDIVVWDNEVIRPDDYARRYFQRCLSTLRSE